MKWKDILQDFDVVVTEKLGVEIKYLYIKGLLYDIKDGYKWRYLNDIKEEQEEVVGIYRSIINLKSIALKGNIGLMEQIYPVAEEEKNHIVEIAFMGTEETEQAWCHRDLYRCLDTELVFVENRRGHREMAKIIRVYDTTEYRGEFEYEVIKGIEI